MTMTKPPPEIWRAIAAAAASHAVPATLLAAIAFQESAWDPKALGPITKGGWRAMGLMQLSPANVKAYDVGDPMDPAESANGAARLLSNLFRASDHTLPSVVAAYNWGIGNVNKGKKWPASVNGYVSAVLANRVWLQHQANTPKGATLYERLRDAIVGLYAVNPGVVEVEELYRSLRAFDVANAAVPDVGFIKAPVVVASLAEYARLYDAAPITTAITPPPSWLIEGTPAALKSIAVKLVQPPAELRQLTIADASPADGAITLTPQVIYGRVDRSENDQQGMGAIALLIAFAFFWATSSRKDRAAWFG